MKLHIYLPYFKNAFNMWSSTLDPAVKSFCVKTFLSQQIFLFSSLTLISAEQCPIPGSLKSRSRGLESGTKAGIRSSRSPTAFRNWMSNSDSGCRDKSQTSSSSEMGKLLAFKKESHKHMIKSI